MITHATLAEQIYDALMARIMNHEITPGQRLPVDALAEEFGVSHTPIKTALHRLASEGLVTVKPRGGASASEFNAKRISDVFDARLLIELHAIEYGLEEANDNHLEKLRSLFMQLEESVRCDPSDLELRLGINDRFHRTIVELADNDVLTELHERLHAQLWVIRNVWSERLRATPGSEIIRSLCADHLRILEACEARNVSAAKCAITSDILTTKDDVLRPIKDAEG